MRIIIIANGEPPAREDIARWLRPGDRLVCADGGARAALALDLRPDIVIGDFDSLSEADLLELERRGAHLRRYSPRKDETDLELALLLTAGRLAPESTGEDAVHTAAAAPEIVVLGAFGGRRDHELANMLLLAMPALKGVRVTLAHGDERLFLIDARDQPAQAELAGRPGDRVSLLPFGGDAHGVRTEGLEYPLRDESLFIGPARGVSNVMQGAVASVAVRSGMLLCVATALGPWSERSERAA
jgi:thiamine pyrophosphokinase